MSKAQKATEVRRSSSELPQRQAAGEMVHPTAVSTAMSVKEEGDDVYLELSLEDGPDPRLLDIDATSNLLFIQLIQDWVWAVVKQHKKKVNVLLLITMLLSFAVYFCFAIAYSIQKATALIVLTALVLFLIGYVSIRNKYGERIYQTGMKPVLTYLHVHRRPIRLIVYPLSAIIILVYMVLEVYESQKQLVPFAGMTVLMLIPLITSKHVTRIRFRPVVWGMGLQFTLGVLVLRWRPGYLAVKFITDQMNQFLSYSMAGAAMAFGDPWFFLHPFAFLVTSLVVFVGGLTGLALHTGLTQTVVSKMAWVMRHTMGTTGIESVSLTANLVFSIIDLMNMFQSYIPKLTKSEFHTFSVGCHCSIAGFAYGLFVIFGASPQHLLTAAVMSAPAAVAISKLSYPETEESHFKDEDDCEMEAIHQGGNAMEAISDGAQQAAKMVMTLIVQVIVFMSVFEWLDVTVKWLGAKVGIELTMRTIFSYLFLPFAYIIGVDPEDVKEVSSVVGMKLVTSEFLAFIELGKLRNSHQISERSAALTTYAICGFSSIGTLAMMVNVWGAVSKQRARDALSQLPRIFINCNIACFLTACVAGILYSEEVLETDAGKSEGPGLFVLISNLIPSYKDILKVL